MKCPSAPSTTKSSNSAALALSPAALENSPHNRSESSQTGNCTLRQFHLSEQNEAVDFYGRNDLISTFGIQFLGGFNIRLYFRTSRREEHQAAR